MVNHCTRCKKDGHRTMGCHRKWPFHTEQECDRCHNPDHPTGDKTCAGLQSQVVCTHCGHEKDHESAMCKIRDVTNDEHINQYTKLKYDLALVTRKKAADDKEARLQANTQTSTTASTGRQNMQGSSSYSIASLTKGTIARGFQSPGAAQASSSRPKSKSTIQDPSKSPIPRKFPIKIVNREAPKLPNEEAEKLRWARASFDPVSYSADVQRNVVVEANFFKVTFDTKEVVLHRYRIELGKINKKEPTKREVRRALIESILHVQRVPNATFWVSDYFSCVISLGPLYSEFKSPVPCAYSVPHFRSPRPGDTEKDILMDTIFWYEGNLKKSVLMKHFNYSDGGSPGRASTNVAAAPDYHPDVDLRALNVVSWKHVNFPNMLGGGRAGKKFYPGRFSEAKELGITGDPCATYVLSAGFFTSMRPGSKSLLLNVNPTVTAFFPAENLLQWLNVKYGSLDGSTLQTASRELEKVRVTFAGDEILDNGKRKQRMIFELLLDPNLAFPNDDGSTTLVRAHMETKYPNLYLDKEPVWVNVGNRTQQVYYAARHLTIAEWQIVRGKIDNVFMKDMLEASEKKPSVNKNGLLSSAVGPLGIVAASTQSNARWPPFYQKFGIKVDRDLVKFNARYLPHPTLAFKNDRETLKLQTNDFGRKATWNLRGVTFSQLPQKPFRLNFLVVGDLAFWRFAVHPMDGNNRVGRPFPFEIAKFDINFRKFLEKNSFKLEQGKREHALSSDPEYLDAAYRKLSKANREKKSITIVLLQSTRSDDYANVKWWGDCVEGIPTICITKEALEKNTKPGNVTDLTFLSNLILKVNFKLSGISHRLLDSKKWSGALENTMIVGADVTHPGRVKNETCPSMAGIVATRDEDCVHYLASARLQRSNTESIADLAGMILDRLDAYHSNLGRLPDHVLFYRDGVSESQFGMVTDKEFPRIQQGCSLASSKYNERDWLPKITILVVGKRHHTRFYPEHPGTTRFNSNLGSGLLVDTVVVAPDRSDFYLQSHDCTMGTARSAHYVVLINESGYGLEALHELTNKLCYTGSRATKGLSVCTPARYADILCDRLRCYMNLALTMQFRDHDTRTLDQYRQDVQSWGQRDQGAGNPWRVNVDNIMFYL